jgi:DNA-binding NarL/FixJ family response regulator
VRENLYDGLRSPRQAKDRSPNSDKVRLVFVAPQQAIYQCLCSALQDHFWDADVFLVDRIDEGGEPDSDVGLVLLGAGARSIDPVLIDRCRRRFPRAAIAVAVDNGLPVVDPQLIVQHEIQGVLPTTLPLDVWFALMRLVMAGGEYLPPAVPVANQPHEPVHQQDMTAGRAPPPGVQPLVTSTPLRRVEGNGEEAGHGLDALTAREREILTLVSEGYQNKLIADRMALSEHTVKAHVHNLIAKLRVTNRTQAAAYLHEHRLDRSAADNGQGERRRAASLG